MNKTICKNCGVAVPDHLDECPTCGEELPDEGSSSDEEKKSEKEEKEEREEREDSHNDSKINEAMQTLDMIDDETFEVKEGDSSSLVNRIKKMAPEDLEKKKKTRKPPLEDEAKNGVSQDEGLEKEEKPEYEKEEEPTETPPSPPEEEEEEKIVEYECPLCGTTVDESMDECPGCGAIFKE